MPHAVKLVHHFKVMLNSPVLCRQHGVLLEELKKKGAVIELLKLRMLTMYSASEDLSSLAGPLQSPIVPCVFKITVSAYFHQNSPIPTADRTPAQIVRFCIHEIAFLLSPAHFYLQEVRPVSAAQWRML